MHKSDVRILKILYSKECTNELKSYSIFQLLTELQCSYSKTYNALNSLSMGEYVSKGMKNSRQDTYYITEKGIEKLRRYCS